MSEDSLAVGQESPSCAASTDEAAVPSAVLAAPRSLQAVCEALSHPARREMIDTLRKNGGEVTAGTIARCFPHAWSTTTRHLRVLEDAGLIERRRIGRTQRYRLTSEPFEALRSWLFDFSSRAP